MVRRAKVPRDSSNRIMYGGFSCRELSGWPDGVAYSPKRRKHRKKREKREVQQAAIDPETLPKFIPEALEIGETL